MSPETCLPLILLLRVKLPLVTDDRKLLISRNVEPHLQTMASILGAVSEASAQTGELCECFEAILNEGGSGKNRFSRILPATHTHMHSLAQKPHHVTQIHGGF